MQSEERETTINWSEADDVATIDTFSRKIMTRCKKMGYLIIDEHRMKDEDGIIGLTFQCPIYAVSFRSSKRQKRELTEEQRKTLAERMRRMPLKG